jgi:integrase
MSVYKRTWKGKDGSKLVRFYFHRTIDGVRYREPIPTARNSAEAERAANKIIARIHEGKYSDKAKESPLFKDFAEKVYLPYSRETKRSHRNDASRIKPLIEFFGDKKLKDISTFEIEAYKIQRKSVPIISRHSDETKRTTRPRSLAVINREICLLSAIFTLAIQKKDAVENPCVKVRLYPENNRIRYLSYEEEDRLLSVLVGKREHLRDLVLLAIHTGMREGELYKLKPGQVDFFRDVIHVTETKTDADRLVPMNQTSREILQRLVKEAKAKGYRYLFTNPKTGKRYSKLKTAWKTACRLAGITNLRFHDLRHTFGTRAADAGVSLIAIAKVMGHASTATTERYAHATSEGMRKAVEALQNVQAPVTRRSQGSHKAEERRVKLMVTY